MKQELGNLMAEDPHQETINLLNYRLNAVTIERDAAREQIERFKSLAYRATTLAENFAEQRDRLAEALERIADYQGRFAEEDPQSIATEALQSLNQPKQ